MRGLLRGMIQCQAFRTRHSSGYLRYIPHYRSTFSSITPSRNVEDELPKSNLTVEPGSPENGFDAPTSSTKTTVFLTQKKSVSADKPRQLPISPLMDPEFHAART